MLNKKIIILINVFLVFNNYLYASQDTHQKPEIVVEQIPPIVKDRLAIAYFGGPEINNLIASALVKSENSEMSAPATNAFEPVPVIIADLIKGLE